MGGPKEGVRDAPPASDSVTDYDIALANHYLRLLAAEAEGASWDEAATLVLGLDCKADPERARRIHDAHLRRAHWISEAGFADLLKRDKCDEPGKHRTS